MEILVDLLAKYPMAALALSILGSLLMIAQIVVVVTPNKKDDEILEKIKQDTVFGKIWSFFLSFAPAQKGAKGLELSATNVEKK